MLKLFNVRYHRFAHVNISSWGENDDSAADVAGGNKKKDVTSDRFLEEEFGGGMGTGTNIDNNVVGINT